MAAGEGSSELDRVQLPGSDSDSPEDPPLATMPAEPDPNQSDGEDEPEDEDDDEQNETEDEDEEEEEEEEEEEPRLKYAPLTKSLSSTYRNGDATTATLVAGDKMIIGTRNGKIHVFSMPSLQPIKWYRAHQASVSAISISPYPPPLPIPTKADAAQRLAPESVNEPTKLSPPTSPNSKSSPQVNPVPRIASNDIYIATASIDGDVCVQSLIDVRDVRLRKFGRPVQAVALSPNYKSDKSYLSGGQEGNLILTIGGQVGKGENATTTGAAAAASGWLGSIGLGSNTGTDKVLHSGEGIISTIKWSLTGKYVLWVNEYGIKIMRSNLKIQNNDTGIEWKRISHISRREKWDDTPALLKARAEWVDRSNLETSEDSAVSETGSMNGDNIKPSEVRSPSMEEVIVGWVNSVWIIKVIPGNKPNEAGHAEITANLEFPDCTISGVSLYTPSLLLILAYMEAEVSSNKDPSEKSKSKGRQTRRVGLQPELRMIDINSKEELETDTLTVNRCETLSSTDYHLGVLHPFRIPFQLAQKGYLGQLGTGMTAVGSGLYQGVETVGQGVWDATLYGPKMLGANRLFSGAETGSIRSGKVGSEKSPSVKGSKFMTGWIPVFGSGAATENEELKSVASTYGIKIFVFSPYDCVVAVKRTLTDRIEWLESREKYQAAWELLNEHPEAATAGSEVSEASSPPTPSKASSVARSGSISSPPPARSRQHQTLAEFFAESASVTGSTPKKDKSRFSNAEKEKRRIGELWLQKLIKEEKWTEAGEIASKVLNTATRWEHWIWVFIKNNQFDAISPHVPAMELTPPLPSSIFEMILGHYVAVNRQRFKELIDQWPSDLFEVGSITAAIQAQLSSSELTKDTRDWRLLQEALAKLYLADGHYKEALRCYVQLQDADTAMSLVKDHHLIEAIADDIPSFVLLRVPNSQLKQGSQQELEELSADPVKLLVDEATHGVVAPEDVVSQLENAKLRLFLFFYLRALWKGDGLQGKTGSKFRHRFATANLAADEGKVLVDQFADTVVELFAVYDRDLLMSYLQTSSSYTFELALKICEKRHYIEEEVYLLSKTGSVKKALFLIIDDLQDVSKAIAFAKEQNDPDLWEDLLEYSMSRPKFISGLLAEVGTAINPITLVRRIPSGIEIEGLKDGLKKMIREYDLQDSISTGVAQVLSSEVAIGMDKLRVGRRRGIKFDVLSTINPKRTAAVQNDRNSDINTEVTDTGGSGRCESCGNTFKVDEKDVLVGFACGHIYHKSHLFGDPNDENDSQNAAAEAGTTDDDEELSSFAASIASKVTNARLLKDKIEAIGGCKACRRAKEKLDQVSR